MKAIIKDMIFSINLKKNLRTNDRVRDVAISYFETYKSYDNMPKSRPTFKTIPEMLKFEKIQNCTNSLIF